MSLGIWYIGVVISNREDMGWILSVIFYIGLFVGRKKWEIGESISLY